MKNFKVAIVQHKVSEPYNNEQNTEIAIRYMIEAKITVPILYCSLNVL